MSCTLLSLLCLRIGLVQAAEGKTGSLLKPFLSALPGPVVAPGGEVIFWCKRPSLLHDWLVSFKLLKDGAVEPLQEKDLHFTQADFSLKSLRVQDSGNYSCIYSESSSPEVKSEPSDSLEIWVTDALPKPSLSAWPSPVVASGGNVTLLCRGPSRGVRFALYKEGEETPVGTSEPTQDGAEFPLVHVSINQTGKYRCSYLLGTDSPVLAPPSDFLEVILQEERKEPLLRREIKIILITAFSCASILFLLFLIFVGHHCHTQTVVSRGETSRRFPSCLCCPWFVRFSSKSGPPQEETEYAQVAKSKHWRMSVLEAEDPEGLTYIQLNARALNNQHTAPGKTSPDPTEYATLALH